MDNNGKFKPKEFAEMLGVSVKTLQRWDKDQKLVAYRTAGNRRYYTYNQYLEYTGESSQEEIRGKQNPKKESIEIALKLIATGVKTLIEQRLNNKFTNIPVNISRGITKLKFASIKCGGNHFDIYRLLRRPIDEWNVDYYSDLFDGRLLEYSGQALVEEGYYTPLCDMLSCREEFNTELELQNLSFMKLFEDEDVYTKARAFLSNKENAILENFELKFRIGSLRINNDEYMGIIENCYEDLSSVYVLNEEVNKCPYCGYPLRKHGKYGWQCIDDRCRKAIEKIGKKWSPSKETIKIRKEKKYKVLKQNIRNSIAYPGQLELDIVEKIRKLDVYKNLVGVTSNPYADAADIEVIFRDGTVWLGDAKHYESPNQLIDYIKKNKILTRIKAQGMKYDKGILILPSFVPDEYLYKIKTHLCKKKYNIDEVYKVNQFLREVRKKVNKYDEIPF